MSTRVDAVDAFAQATFHLAAKANSRFFAIGLEDWTQAGISSATVFYDAIYGQTQDPVLYVFNVAYKKDIVGHLAVPGSRLAGNTLAYLNPSCKEPLESLLKAVHIAIGKVVTQKILEELPVVYSYPKLGVRIRLENGALRYFDLFDFHEINPATPPATQGCAVWSFWDEYPQGGDPAAAWDAQNGFIHTVTPNVAALVKSKKVNGVFRFQVARALGSAAVAPVRNYVEQNPPVTDAITAPCQIIGQPNDSYCAPTSLVMIYQYVYGTALNINDVAAKMGTDVVGTTFDAQVGAYNFYFGTDFNIVTTHQPTVQMLHDSIYNYLPLKSGILGHARVANGYSKDTFVDPKSGSVKMQTDSLLISDPLPVGQGSQRWDAWGANLRDFIILSRKTPG